MDQSVLAGVGNVYRCEVLHRHRTNPFTLGTQLKRATWERIWADLVDLLPLGVAFSQILTLDDQVAEAQLMVADGSAEPIIRESTGERLGGHFERRFAVYKRTGLACPRCGKTCATRTWPAGGSTGAPTASVGTERQHAIHVARPAAREALRLVATPRLSRMALSGGRPAPTHVIAHLSDPHLLGTPGGRLAGRIDTADQLRRALARVEASGEAIDALVISGDLTDSGEPAAYELLLDIVRPVVDRLGCALVLTGGNHDERGPLARVLFGVEDDAPRTASRRCVACASSRSTPPCPAITTGASLMTNMLGSQGNSRRQRNTARSSSSIMPRSRIAPRSCSCSTSTTWIDSGRLWPAPTCGPCSVATCT